MVCYVMLKNTYEILSNLSYKYTYLVAIFNVENMDVIIIILSLF
jgi:hypothetical protein